MGDCIDATTRAIAAPLKVVTALTFNIIANYAILNCSNKSNLILSKRVPIGATYILIAIFIYLIAHCLVLFR